MGFISVDKVPKAIGNRSCVPYFRLARLGDCSFSRPFLESRDADVDSVDFEVDFETGAFRFRLGKGYSRPIKNLTFSIPASVANLIWEALKKPPRNNFVQRSLYCKIISLTDGWYTGEFGSYVRPTVGWPKEGNVTP